jgi:cell wall-associated NlpC family hydrolase
MKRSLILCLSLFVIAPFARGDDVWHNVYHSLKRFGHHVKDKFSDDDDHESRSSAHHKSASTHKSPSPSPAPDSKENPSPSPVPVDDPGIGASTPTPPLAPTPKPIVVTPIDPAPSPGATKEPEPSPAEVRPQPTAPVVDPSPAPAKGGTRNQSNPAFAAMKSDSKSATLIADSEDDSKSTVTTPEAKGDSKPAPSAHDSESDAKSEGTSKESKSEAKPSQSTANEKSESKSGPSSVDSQTKKSENTNVASLKPEDLAEYAGQPEKVQKIVREGLELTEKGLSYQYGSSDPAAGGMDCSGYIYFVLKEAGFADVPRQSNEQYAWVRKESEFHSVLSRNQDTFELQELRPGDLMFWSGTYKADRDIPITHVMIYLGTEKATRKPVMVGASDGRRYDGVRRSGVSVFDFKLPSGKANQNDPELVAKFEGYGTVPGLRGAKVAFEDHAEPEKSPTPEPIVKKNKTIKKKQIKKEE